MTRRESYPWSDPTEEVRAQLSAIRNLLYAKDAEGEDVLDAGADYRAALGRLGTDAPAHFFHVRQRLERLVARTGSPLMARMALTATVCAEALELFRAEDAKASEAMRLGISWPRDGILRQGLGLAVDTIRAIYGTTEGAQEAAAVAKGGGSKRARSRFADEEEAWTHLYALLPLLDGLRASHTVLEAIAEADLERAKGGAPAGVEGFALQLGVHPGAGPLVGGPGDTILDREEAHYTLRAVSEAVEGLALVPEEELAPAARALGRVPDHTALERNLMRSPAFRESRAAQVQLELFTRMGSIHERPFELLAPDGVPTVRDSLLMAHLTSLYGRQGFRRDQIVRSTLVDCIGAMAYTTDGGRQRALVDNALGRLRSATFRHRAYIPGPDGGSYETLQWGLIEWAKTSSRGPVEVKLSDPLVSLLARGSIGFFHEPTFQKLVTEDELAARLWLELESHRYEQGAARRRRLFSAPEGDPQEDYNANLPCIADLLGIADWKRRAKVAERVKRAASRIVARDPRYRLSVERSKAGRGMYNLVVQRSAAGAAELPAPTGEPVLLGTAEPVLLGTGARTAGDGKPYSRGRRAVLPGTGDVLPGTGSRSTEGDIENRIEGSSRGSRRTSARTSSSTKNRRDEPSSSDWEDERALLERWPKVTPAQRKKLAELRDRHGGSSWAAAIIRDCPEDRDPLAELFRRDSAWKAERMAAEDRAIEAHERAKEDDKSMAGVYKRDLDNRVQDWAQERETDVVTLRSDAGEDSETMDAEADALWDKHLAARGARLPAPAAPTPETKVETKVEDKAAIEERRRKIAENLRAAGISGPAMERWLTSTDQSSRPDGTS